MKKPLHCQGDLCWKKIAEDYPNQKILYYDSPQACFDAILKGEADTTYVNTHIADYLLSDLKYSGLSAATLSNYTEERSTVISSDADPRLFSILDKCIQYTATEQMDNLILKNAINLRDITWQDIIWEHPFGIIGGTVVFFSIITVLLVYLLILKSNSARKIEKLLYRDGRTDI